MITYEEYEKRKDYEDDSIKLPTMTVVIAIVLFSLIGIFIVFEAIYGL